MPGATPFSARLKAYEKLLGSKKKTTFKPSTVFKVGRGKNKNTNKIK